MMEIRLHGRGGQGVVTAAALIAKAATLESKFAHSFPSFGAERRGAPVLAFVRINDSPIRTKQQIYEPDAVIVFDPTVYKFVPISQGVKEDGTIIINTANSASDVRDSLNTAASVFTVDATSIANKIFGRPVTNTVMLGAFARISPVVTLSSLKKVVNERFGDEQGLLNAMAMEAAYGSI